MLFPSALMWIVFGALSAYLAKMRGKNPYLWFFLGMLFGVFGLLFLFFAPKPRSAPSREKRGSDDPKTIDISPPYDPTYNEKFWYYLDGQNQQFGPMSFDALYRLLGEEKVSKKTFVWNESLESWKSLEEFF
jgi:hypothetical protein